MAPVRLYILIFSTLLFIFLTFFNLYVNLYETKDKENKMSEIIKKEYEVKEFSKLHVGGPGKVILTQSETCALTIEAPEDMLESLVVTQEGDSLRIHPETMGFFRWIFNHGLHFNGENVTYTVSMKEIKKLGFGGSLVVEAGPIVSKALKINNSGSVKSEFDALSVDEELAISNSGSVKSKYEAIKAEDLAISASGAANIVVEDIAAKSLKARASGSMKLTVNNGSVQSQEYHISGSGRVDTVELQSNSAKVSISGSGKATVWAEETIKVSVSGSGTIYYKGNAEVDQHVSGSGKVKKVHPEMETA